MDFFRKAEDALHDVKEALTGEHKQEQEQQQEQEQEPPHDNDGGRVDQQQISTTKYRFQSFAPETSGAAKWYVDGASYFYAVSLALEGTPFYKNWPLPTQIYIWLVWLIW